MTGFTITPRGPFSLAAAERFFGRWEGTTGTDTAADALRVAFLVDDWSGAAGLLVAQDERGDAAPPADVTPAAATVRGEIVATTDAPEASRVQAQLARVLSLDHDATGYVELGERDPVIGRLQRAADHLRPVLFHSPYEAACWAIVSSRIQQRQAQRLRAQISEQLEVDGVALDVWPAPERLLARDTIAGLPTTKVERLHAIARAALDGDLDAERLRELEPEEAIVRLQDLPGIGPFWASLIVLRAVGPTDALALGEPRTRRAAARAYDRPELERDDDAFVALAETWRPYRTWVSVLLRATAAD
jgi:DNA-3-methyladenine glycosylase II